MTVDPTGNYILSPDCDGDKSDACIIDNNDRRTGLLNYFDDLYRRKVTVAHPGNRSIVVVVWAKLYLDNVIGCIKEIVSAVDSSDANFKIEVAGFTHDAVSCFITDPAERQAPGVYKKHFVDNIAELVKIRGKLAALRLIADRNMQNVSLDLNPEAMARICAEYSARMCEHYLVLHPAVVDYNEYPFESFGISSILFDVEYYKKYILNKIVIDKSRQQEIDKRVYNINALAQSTNPVLKDILKEIHEFYDSRAAHAKAVLALSGGVIPSDIVGEIDRDLKGIVNNLQKKINALFTQGQLSIFESEALLALILADDCSMFESSAVNADETTIDDIIDESVKFFIQLDADKKKLRPVSQSRIKTLRNYMRNIAVANRKRQSRLDTLYTQIQASDSTAKHLDGKGYHFGGKEYKVDLPIDSQPLALTYEPHDVQEESIDLRDLFAPVRNQGKQGSCAAFAISSVIEIMRSGHNRYSPAFLYWIARENNGTAAADIGASLYDVINAATTRGICREVSMPYNEDIITLAPSEAAFGEAADCKVLEAKTVEPNLKDIKSALNDGFPVIIGVQIFDSFSDTRKGFIRQPSRKELNAGEDQGSHAMVICGYSDKEKILVVRNSWGSEFGDNGYCYMPYSYARKYINQACIITQLTSSAEVNEVVSDKKTLDFNLSDTNIEAAVLQNLIQEDNYELDTLAEESARLKTHWSQNVATLVNVNNQRQIIDKAKSRLDEEIFNANCVINELQDSKNQKLSEFKHSYIKILLYSGIFCLLAWLGVYLMPKFTMPWVIAGILSAFFIGLLSAFGYNWRRYRQQLRDEIQSHANKITSLQQYKASLSIKAHIHGSIIRDVEDFRLTLLSRHMHLKEFNEAWIALYHSALDEQSRLSPQVPYPFLSVLSNERLDLYYSDWRNKMLDSVNIKAIYEDFTKKHDLPEIISTNTSLNDSVIRGLRNFSMKEYVCRQHPDKWRFLPETAKMSDVIPDLDSRAIPFCPYNLQGDTPIEKFILVKDITYNDMRQILPYFTQAPMPVSTRDPFSICIINTVRYNLT